jgi:WD40 repeat protein
MIASGGFSTICFWNAMTGELVVGPTKGLGETVMSLVWSSDNTKLYSAAGSITRIFDSKSGELLYSFQPEHDNILSFIALSPQQKILACVGNNGVAQLWDTEFNQPLRVDQQFNREPHSGWLTCVSFSRDGKYIAYSGENGKLALWVLEAMAQENQPNSPPSFSSSSSSCLNVSMFTSDCPSSLLTALLQADATGCDGFIEEAHNDPYQNFFQVGITYAFYTRALVLTIITGSLHCNLFHRHPLAPIFLTCFQLAAS